MAVYTKLTQLDIERHLGNYSIGLLVDFKEIIEGIDNSNFILTTTSGKFILTIFEARIDKNQLPFFINFKLHLAQNGICCPRPILDNQGASIVDLQEKKSAIVTFLSGATLQPQNDGYYSNITAAHCYEIGKALAQLHLAACGFKMKRENELGVNGFRALFSKFSGLVDGYQENLGNEILAMIDFLEKSWKPSLPSAAAHLDLFPDNVFFANSIDANNNFMPKVSGIIDFYFAANDALILDFAIAVNAWCFDENNIFDEEKFNEMRRGYEELRKFAPAELEFLKIALCAAALRFLLTRLHDKFYTPKNSLVKIKNPQEYLVKLNFFKTKL